MNVEHKIILITMSSSLTKYFKGGKGKEKAEYVEIDGKKDEEIIIIKEEPEKKGDDCIQGCASFSLPSCNFSLPSFPKLECPNCSCALPECPQCPTPGCPTCDCALPGCPSCPKLECAVCNCALPECPKCPLPECPSCKCELPQWMSCPTCPLPECPKCDNPLPSCCALPTCNICQINLCKEDTPNSNKEGEKEVKRSQADIIRSVFTTLGLKTSKVDNLIQYTNDPQGCSWDARTDWQYKVTLNSNRQLIKFDIPSYSNNLVNPFFPTSMGELTSLTELKLRDLKISGKLPYSIGKLTDMIKLDLSSNKLDGNIPDSIGELTGLTELDLSSNKFTGTLPASIGKLNKLTILRLSGNSLNGQIPESIGELTGLTVLHLSSNKFTGALPASIRKLTNLAKLYLISLEQIDFSSIGSLNKLTELNLSRNKLTGDIPEFIGELSNLTKLDLFENELTGPGPILKLNKLSELNLSYNKFIGQTTSSKSSPTGMKSNLKHLNLYNNKLTEIPAWIVQFTQLAKLNLNCNELTKIPIWIGQLSQLREFNLSSNKLTDIASIGDLGNLEKLELEYNDSLTGHLPVTPTGCEVKFDSPYLSRVTIRVKKLSQDNYYMDYWLIVMYVVLGYADLASDILAINELFAVGRNEVGGLNIAFLFLNVLLGLFSARSMKDAFLTIFQLSGLVDGYETIMKGEQTEGLVAGKKLDAVARSMPSMVLQLFSLFVSLSTITDQGYATLVASIALGAFGAATTLASMAPKSGRHLFNLRFLIHIMYFFSELLLRIIIISIMFLSIRGIAFVVLIFMDLLVRFIYISELYNCFWKVWNKKDIEETDCCKIDFSSTILWFGSDAATNNHINWLIGSLINIVELLMFLLIINFLKTDDLEILREEDTARNITIISCISLLVKTVMYFVIEALPAEKVGYQPTPEIEMTNDTAV